VEKGKDKGKVLALKENTPFLIGRDLKTHLRLRDQQVSRRHLKITYRLSKALLEDLDSSNGTLVNGARVRSAELRPNDKIQVGETLIFYLEEESLDEGATTTTESGSIREAPTQEQRVRKGELTDAELSGYRIGRLLGRGGMGTVYEAVQVSLERRVAFKVLAGELAADTQFVDRFTAEARAAGQLNHPNIVQVYDVGVAQHKTKAVRFYSMEFMAGGSVEDLLRKEGRLPVEGALPIVFDAARGLEYAERHGVVHRDIKPDNLMISEDGVVKIGDLGIATRRRSETEASQEEGVSGSPHYMAPEQALGRAIDHRADLYALGVSLYQILSGDTPYEGSSAREVILKHLNEAPPPLAGKCPQLDPEIVKLVERLMEKDPARRVASASVLLQELVPLVKRYPLAATSRLRIDGIIAQRTELQVAALPPGSSSRTPGKGSGPAARPPLPDTQPSTVNLAKAETTELPTTQVPRRALISRAALVRAALILGSLALGIIAFTIVSSIQRGANTRRQEREKALQEVRSLLDKDPADCERRAKDLALKFERDAHHDEASKAAEIAGQATAKLTDAEEKRRAKEAQEAYKRALEDVGRSKDDANDPDGVAYYDHAVKAWSDYIQKYPGTLEADHAARDLRLARSALDDARARSEGRMQREKAAERALFTTKDALDGLYRQRRFEDANHIIEAYEHEHGKTKIGAAAVPKLRDDLLDRGKAVLSTVRKQADDAAAARRWDSARAALRELLDAVKGVKTLEDLVSAEITRLTAAEQKDRDSEIESKDQERKKSATEAARAREDLRDYEEAATLLEDASARIHSAAIRKELDRRACILREAALAIRDVVLCVQKQKHPVTLPNGFVADGATSGHVHFKGTGGKTQEVAFGQATPKELLRWVAEAAGNNPDADTLLHAAALAAELGEKEIGGRYVAAASDAPLTAEQKARLEEIRAGFEP
jgi:serine/threonine protein kinase